MIHHRQIDCCAPATNLSALAKACIDLVFATDVPIEELAAAWGGEVQMGGLLRVSTINQARHREDDLGLPRCRLVHGRDVATVAHHRHIVAGD